MDNLCGTAALIARVDSFGLLNSKNLTFWLQYGVYLEISKTLPDNLYYYYAPYKTWIIVLLRIIVLLVTTRVS